MTVKVWPGVRTRRIPLVQHQKCAVGRLTDALCLELGYSKSLGIVESHNYASIANSLRLGNQIVGSAGYFKLFGRVYPFRSRGARRHTFRFVRSADNTDHPLPDDRSGA